MINFETLKYDNDIGAGALQDIHALIVFGKDYKGTFVDIGCRHPVNHNNTYFLEKYGWKGYAVDLANFDAEWKTSRPNTVYENLNAFDVNYEEQFNALNDEPLIDFLSIDLEVPGDRFRILERVFETGYNFKAITIEHDNYCIPSNVEMNPQRQFLTAKGYTLVRKCDSSEDFWINPNYIDEDQYQVIMTYNDDNPEIHPWTYLKNVGYDWTHFYNI